MLKKTRDWLDRLEEHRWTSDRQIGDLFRRIAQLETDKKRTEEALLAIYDFLGVDWSIPGKPRLVRKGGPEEPRSDGE